MIDPRVIRRYTSRKLYDTAAHAYIKSEKLLQLYRLHGQQVVVVCMKSNEDVTVTAIASAVSDVAHGDVMVASRVAGLVREGIL